MKWHQLIRATAVCFSKPQTYKTAVNFFCLLRDFICDRPESRITTAKVQDIIQSSRGTDTHTDDI